MSIGPKIDLYLFAISHYCEKSRWALDWHGLAYRPRFMAPGQHVQEARKRGLSSNSLPWMVADGEVVQGSAAIEDWADAHGDAAKSLTPPELAGECAAIEQRLDAVLGVHVRRYFYAEAMVDHPQSVRPVFTRELSLPRKLLVSMAWSKIRAIMIKRLDLGPAQRVASRDIVNTELEWLDGLLAGGKTYLVGGRFTRADLAAASLLAPLAAPPEHPVYAQLNLPPITQAETAAWAERPSLRHVREMYRRHR